MAKLKIVKFGDETLRKVCRPVGEITPKIITLIDDMIETMRDADGCGLAKDSIVLLEQVRTIDKRRLKEKMGNLNAVDMGRINKALSVSFGLDSSVAGI